MPIYEYQCRDCDHDFEALVQGRRVPVCPACDGDALDRRQSAFAVGRTSITVPAHTAGSCGTCGDPRGPGACSLN